MVTMLNNWKGVVEFEGKQYDSVKAFVSDFKPSNDEFHIVLRPTAKKPVNEAETKAQTHNSEVKEQKEVKQKEVRITVRQYMCKKAEPGFDFMANWNNDVPMPLRTMTGFKIKETPGMVYMKLHGDIWAEKICTCMKCGRDLTNPVSQFFGIGPECGGHNYVNPFNSDAELKEAVAEYKKKLQAVVWEGWVIRKAITEIEEV